MSELLVSLLTFAAVSTVSPGGATTLATASGARFGCVRSLPLISGIAIGLGSLVGAAAVGLASMADLGISADVVNVSPTRSRSSGR